MSTVLTISALQCRSDLELQILLQKAQSALACSRAGSEERREALETIDNIARVMCLRRFRPRPPCF